jgi:hypothetical protein
MSLDLSDVVTDPDLGESFQVKRPTDGQFVREGEWQQNDNPVPIDMFGVITPSKANDVAEFVPEGERATEMITVYTKDPVYMTDGLGRLSDFILWNNGSYKVVFSKPWKNHGYYFVIGAKQ